jgi:hypothetical protein
MQFRRAVGEQAHQVEEQHEVGEDAGAVFRKTERNGALYLIAKGSIAEKSVGNQLAKDNLTVQWSVPNQRVVDSHKALNRGENPPATMVASLPYL